jgi:hypothetical protein
MNQSPQPPIYKDIKYMSLENVRVSKSHKEGLKIIEFKTRDIHGSFFGNKWSLQLVIEGVYASISKIIELDKSKFYSPTIGDIVKEAQQGACDIQLTAFSITYFWLHEGGSQSIPIVD